jgi:uncharacterized protein (TIGR02996 family)
MRTCSHRIAFLHRSVVEVGPLADLLPADRLRRERAEWDRPLRPSPAADPFPAFDGNGGPADDFRLPDLIPHGWYGVEPNVYLPVFDCVPVGDGVVLELARDAGCRVRRTDVAVRPQRPGSTALHEARPALTPLADGPMADALLDPARSLFRAPAEAGFWERMASEPLDATARLVYADWLDEHDDPYGWVFREVRPFRAGPHRFDWIGAVGRVNCAAPYARTLWQFAGAAGRGSAVPFTLPDGAPVPPFVAYLLGVTRIRADRRLPPADRARLADCAQRLGLSVMADMIFGPKDELICRVEDPVRALSLLDEAAGGPPVPPAELVARLRAVNHG